MTEFNAQRVIDLLKELEYKNSIVSQLIDDLIQAGGSAATSTDDGVPAMTIRSNGYSTRTTADGQYQALSTDRFGRLYVVTDPLELLRVDRVADTPSAGDNTYYQGFALPGTANNAASWRIKRIEETVSGDVTITYANGTDTPTNVWNSRGTYVYS